jgi:hypothetical protein
MMNIRPFADRQPQAHLMNLVTRARHGLYLVIVCLLLAGCWGDDQPPATVEPAAEAPVSALPTDETGGETESETQASAPISDTAAPTQATTDTTTAEVAATEPTSTAASEAVTTTEAAPSPTATFVPLEAEAADNCEVESSLDLVGYPNLEQRMGCAIEAAIFDPIAINEFGPADQPVNRFMLWFSHENMIYVLLPDGTYERYEDTWQEDVDPTYPCNPSGGEEDSPPLPRRGFGKLWCSSPELQEILGTVPREERLCQYAVLQRFESGRLLACFEDATIRYFRILDDGTWDLQAQ